MKTVPFVSFDAMHSEIRAQLDNAYKTVMDSNYFIQGQACAQFEKEYADYCGVKHCIGVGNGLDALMLILRAMEIGDGDEVGVVGVGLARPVADGLDCYAFGAGDVAACLDVGLGAVEIEARVRPVAVGIGRSAEDAVIAVSRQVCPKVRRRIVCDAKPDVANAVVHHDKSILHVGIWFVKKMRRGGGGFYRAKRRRNGERRNRNGCGEPLDSRHRTETFGMSMFHYVRSFCFWFTLLLTTFSHFG